MAKQNNQPQEMSERSDAGEGRSILGAVAGAAITLLHGAAMLTSIVWDKFTGDGVLAAAGRQGADEIGTALKAFPDAIQAAETGTIFNPTQGEVAQARSGHESHSVFRSRYYSAYTPPEGTHASWPSEIAKSSHTHGAGEDHGYDQGRDQGDGHSM
jgi:hypothetical protein